MLIGAHVSTAGGLVNAWERGRDMGCDAIQVFNQSPRQWRPTRWKDDDIAEFRERMADGPIKSVVIHAVYLINCASKDKEIRSKSIASLVHSLQMGDAIGADGVVLHPGSTVGEPHGESMKRIGKALDAGAGRVGLLPAAAGGHRRRGQHHRPHVRGAGRAGLAGRRRQAGGHLPGLLPPAGQRLRRAHRRRGGGHHGRRATSTWARSGCKCLHVNDSKMPLASNRDRHAPLGTGEIGARGCGAFLSEPRFEDLPALFEGPGFEGNVAAPDIKRMRELRRNGLRARTRRG